MSPFGITKFMRHAMKYRMMQKKRNWAVSAIVFALLLAVGTGCKSKARNDQQITTDVQAKIQNESALAGQSIQVAVQNGVATLNGSVTDAASRALAANDAAGIDGVKTVVNNLTVQSGQQGSLAPAPPERVADRPSRTDRRPQPVRQEPTPAPPVMETDNSNPYPRPAPPTAPKPVAQRVTLPSGTVIPFRITETLDSKNAQPNGVFHGVVANDIAVNGATVVPRGTPVMGRIVNAQEAAHFKGNSLLSLELTQMQFGGQRVTLVTNSYVKQGAARGKNTAIKAGGGAALGALIGGLAGGGKGAAIGGLAGAGAGVGVNAATRGQQTVIPTETVINFQLQSPITVILPPSGMDERSAMQDPQLQRR
jgi:hypothetical protein